MPLTDKLIAGLNTAANVGSGIIGGLFSMRSQRKANEANMKMAKYAYSKDLEQWERANAYNTPSAQMQRLEQAGLNPKLIYGQGGGTTQAVQSPKYQAPDIKPVPMDFTSGVPNTLLMYQDMQIKQQQLDNLQAQERALNETIQGKAWDNYLKEKIFEDKITGEKARLRGYGYKNESEIARKNLMINRSQWESMTAQDRADAIKKSNALLDARTGLIGKQGKAMDQSFQQKSQIFPYQLSALQAKNRLTNVDIERKIFDLKFKKDTRGFAMSKMEYETELAKLKSEWYIALAMAEIGSKAVGAITDVFPATKISKKATEAFNKKTQQGQQPGAGTKPPAGANQKPRRRVASKGARESLKP